MATYIAPRKLKGTLFSGHRTGLQLALGLGVLLLGALVYVLDRSPAQVPLLSAFNLFGQLPSVFGPIGDSLPTFAHAFAFAVLSAVILGNSRKVAFWTCLGWFGVDAAFEIGQHPHSAEALSQFLPASFEHLPILTQIESYFVLGTFAVWDLISIGLGAISAYLVLRWSDSTRELTHD